MHKTNYKICQMALGDPECQEATYFAVALLVPEYELEKVMNVTSDISELARYFGVAEGVIALRLKYLEEV